MLASNKEARLPLTSCEDGNLEELYGGTESESNDTPDWGQTPRFAVQRALLERWPLKNTGWTVSLFDGAWRGSLIWLIARLQRQMMVYKGRTM